jgi:hypothetical protein
MAVAEAEAVGVAEAWLARWSLQAVKPATPASAMAATAAVLLMP